MRKLFLDELPKININNYIDWSMSVGHVIKFEYDDIVGEFEIVEYDIKKNELSLGYLGEIHKISTSTFKRVGLKKIFGMINYDRWSVGDVVDLSNTKIEILNLIKKYGSIKYECKCISCGYEWIIDKNGILNKSKCINCSNNTFKLSEDGNYWIGTTSNGCDFWFDGDENMINYIKSFTWSKDQYNYFKNKKGERLHRVIMKTTDSFIYINHLGGNKYDNRVQNLTISNCLDNSKEKRVGTRNKSGIVGLMKRGKSDKWVGSVRVEGVVIYSKYKTKEEALIDLLILQKHYGFRHNTHLYNLIDDICPDRENEVINLSKEQIKRAKLKIPNIKSKNTYELSNCKTYYRVYDVNKNYFIIDVHNKKVIEEGIWRLAYPNKLSDKPYVLGDVIINGIRKGVKLHRYLFDLLELKYKNIYVDHLNGDGCDNRMDNLALTDASGNSKNKIAKRYYIRTDGIHIGKGIIRGNIRVNGVSASKTFTTTQDAELWVNEQKKISLTNRLTFKSKQEVDIFLNTNGYSSNNS